MKKLEGSINWENWYRIVEKTKNEIEEYLKEHPKIKPTFKLYNEDGEKAKEFETQTQCAEFLNATKTTVCNYMKKQWNYNDYLLSKEDLTKDVAFALFKYNIKHGNVYIPGATKKKVPIYSYNEDGKLVGAYETQYQWSKVTNKGISLITNCDRIINDRLTSRNRYDKETATIKYKETLAKEPNNLSVYIYNKSGELMYKKVPTRYIIKLSKVSYSTIYRHFNKSQSFYLNGYVISKQALTQSEIKKILN